MDYIEIEVFIGSFSEEIADIIIAELAEAGCDSFETAEPIVKAYIPEKYFNKENVDNILNTEKYKSSAITYNIQQIKAQNWNAVWESNFEPIVIKNEILVKAPFHNITENYKYVIEIEPKMSFGTGHHETTSLILEQMTEELFKNKKVLDMGSGTGILAIFSEMLGASEITAIDIDEWAFENCEENISRNNCTKIKALLGDASVIPQEQFDIIIANINRNILLQDIRYYNTVLKNNGTLFLSGFYQSDIEAISQETSKYQLQLIDYKEKKNWVACNFQKKS